MLSTHAKLHKCAQASLKTTALHDLMNIFKQCESRVKNDVKQSCLTLCIRQKWESCDDSKTHLSMDYVNELVNVEQNTYLGVGEDVSVAKWLKFRQFGGQNRVGLTWMKIKYEQSNQ